MIALSEIIKIFIASTLFFITTFKVEGQGIIIPGGAFLFQSAGILCTQNNFTNNGVYSSFGGTIIFNGAIQHIGGSSPTTFNNITILNGSTTTIQNSGIGLAGVLLCNGILNSNGNLTLISNATKTALIDGAGTGTVNGNVIMQRYLPSRFGYKFISSPFQKATVNEFANEVILNASFPPVYKYIENLPSNGWFHYSNNSDTLFPLLGYAVNFGNTNAPLTLDIAGVVNNGTLSSTLYNTNQVYTQGFNLVGNPYPSPIDWNASSGWTKHNIDNAIYFFDASSIDQYTGTYSSYINGVSSNGIANNIIPSMQGFFVHVSNGVFPVSGTLTINNNSRVNSSNPSFHKDKDSTTKIRLSLCYKHGDVKCDHTVIYFADTKDETFNRDLEALKIYNTDSRVPNLYTITSDNQQVSINAVKQLNDTDLIIPLGIRADKSFGLTLKLTQIDNFPYDTRLHLVDKYTAKYVDLLKHNEDTEVEIFPDAIGNRYVIVCSKSDISTSTLLKPNLNAYYDLGTIYVGLNLYTGTTGDISITNISGQIVYSTHFNNSHFLKINAPWPSGVYIIKLNSGNRLITKKILVNN